MKFITKPFFILSCDGGGVRGVLTAALLERLNFHRPGFLPLADMFAGTSTGSIIASSLALGMKPGQIRQAYEKLAPKIFRGNFFKRIPLLGNAISSKYHNRNLKNELNKVFGTITLGELPKKVIITAFDLDGPAQGSNRPRSWRPKFYNNYQSDDQNKSVVEVILSSTAAPTYFPAWGKYIDGGVAANNPSMAALAQAIDSHTGKQLLSNIVLLSCGTGLTPAHISQRNLRWGWLPWVNNLIEIMLDGNVSIADYQVKRLLDNQYFRLNPILGYSAPMDDLRLIPHLKQTASQEDLVSILYWLDTHLEGYYIKSTYMARGQH